MLNMKRITIFALLLLVIGIAGSLFTYQSYADSGPVKEEMLFNETITDIIVESNNSKIEILPSSDETAKVEFTLDSRNKSRYNLEVVVEHGTLNVKVKEKILQFFNFDFNFKSVVTRVYLPEQTYDSVMAKTENGAVTIENIAATSVTGESTNGSITMKSLNAQEIITKTENGKINLVAVEGELRAQATNGQIKLETETIDHPIDFETVNGKILIQTNEKPKNAEISVDVVNGSVNIFGENNRHTVIGNGENKISLHTVNGGITVGN